jgi:hypothetical protein
MAARLVNIMKRQEAEKRQNLLELRRDYGAFTAQVWSLCGLALRSLGAPHSLTAGAPALSVARCCSSGQTQTAARTKITSNTTVRLPRA